MTKEKLENEWKTQEKILLTVFDNSGDLDKIQETLIIRVQAKWKQIKIEQLMKCMIVDKVK